jgi:site-specific DNA-methyltransferase (adenine-specific)
MIKLINDNCIEALKLMPSNSVDSIVTDPPYELGFMGKAWDSTGIANDVSMWREALRVLKPGGHLIAFSGTRTYHRMASAIEDAGFEIRDMMQWLYGSGMPHGKNIGDGWNTALKPANEPMVLARKPISEKTVADNVMRWGTGGINIDDSRIGTEERTFLSKGIRPGSHNIVGDNWTGNQGNKTVVGRFPANVLFDESAAAILDEQSGITKSSSRLRKNSHSNDNVYGNYHSFVNGGYGDSGGASRFFYCAKASKHERGEGNDHATVKPLKLMEYLVTLVTPPNGTVLDPFMGSGTTGIVAKNKGFSFIGIEQDKHYCDIANRRIQR